MLEIARVRPFTRSPEPIGDFLDTSLHAVHADGRPDHALDDHRLTADEPARFI
jgi:hypothetical protein